MKYIENTNKARRDKIMKRKKEMASGQIDWVITLVPLILILFLASLFFAFPEQSNQIVGQIRYVFGDTFGVYYLIIGLGILFVSIYLAGSKYGTIVLGGQEEKPKYSFWVCRVGYVCF